SRSSTPSTAPSSSLPFWSPSRSAGEGDEGRPLRRGPRFARTPARERRDQLHGVEQRPATETLQLLTIFLGDEVHRASDLEIERDLRTGFTHTVPNNCEPGGEILLDPTWEGAPARSGALPRRVRASAACTNTPAPFPRSPAPSGTQSRWGTATPRPP